MTDEITIDVVMGILLALLALTGLTAVLPNGELRQIAPEAEQDLIEGVVVWQTMF